MKASRFRTLLAGGVVAALLSSCGSDQPAPQASAWSPVADRIARGEDPAYLHLRLTQDGTLALRFVEREGGRWREEAAVAMAREDEAGATALGRARERMEAWTAEPRFQESDGSAAVRLIVEADAEVPWRRVAWILVLAKDPRIRIWRLTFLAPDDSGTIGMELPRDRSGPSPDWEANRPAVVIEARMFRKEKTGPAPWTRLKLRSRLTRVTEHGGDWIEIVSQGPTAAEAAPSDDVAHDLRPGIEEAAWRAAEATIRERAREAPIVLGEFSAPPPDGPAVPYGDAYRVWSILREAGATSIWIRGASAPLLSDPPGADDR